MSIEGNPPPVPFQRSLDYYIFDLDKSGTVTSLPTCQLLQTLGGPSVVGSATVFRMQPA